MLPRQAPAGLDSHDGTSCWLLECLQVPPALLIPGLLHDPWLPVFSPRSCLYLFPACNLCLASAFSLCLDPLALDTRPVTIVALRPRIPVFRLPLWQILNWRGCTWKQFPPHALLPDKQTDGMAHDRAPHELVSAGFSSGWKRMTAAMLWEGHRDSCYPHGPQHRCWMKE